MADSNLQSRVMAALSPTPVELALDVIAYRPFDRAPVTTYTRFLGERAASSLVENPHDERAVLDFLSEVEEADLAAATESQPIALRASRAARKLRFDVRVVIHPSVAEAPTSLKTAAFLGPLTYLTFPAYDREFAPADSVDAARFQLEQVPYKAWDRSQRVP